jgi:ketosteroid isomerase-like protein
MTPAEFIPVFIEGWTRSQPEDWIDFFRPLVHPDVVVTQPMLPTAIGPEAYMNGFRNTFDLMRDMAVEVLSTAVSEDAVFIESRVSATIGGRRFSFDVADRFQFRDGLIYRRASYFDPMPIIVAVLLRPWVLPTVVRGFRG